MFLTRRVVVLDKVTDLLLFFGKLLVVGGVGEDYTVHHAKLIYSSALRINMQVVRFVLT